MQVDYSSQQLKTDEVKKYLRLAHIMRSAAVVVLIGVIGVIAAASLPPLGAERSLLDASVSEMQLYAVPPAEGLREDEPAPSVSSSGTSDEELRSLDGVVHHG